MPRASTSIGGEPADGPNGLPPFSVAFTAGPRSPLFVVACAVATFVVWSHRANIQRLRAGTESRIGRPTEATR